MNAFKAELLYAYDAEVPPYGNGRAEKSGRMAAWLLRKGGLRLKTGRSKTRAIKPGSWIIPATETERFQIFEPESSLLSICFTLTLPDGRQAFPLSEPLIFPAHPHAGLEASAGKLVEEARGLADHPVNQTAKGARSLSETARLNAALWGWLSSLISALDSLGVKPQEPQAIDGRMRHMTEILAACDMAEGIPYKELERSSGLGRVQIDRLFRKCLGVTPKGFKERRLLDDATEMLLLREDSIKEIAGALGFSRESHFCFWFKRKTGRRPSEYRETPC